jgi:hypothetical protein
VLAYLSRYTHRVAIANSRLIAADASGVTFSYKDYRIEGPGRYKTMTLTPTEFIRRFLMHVLPKGFHRIRHCGLLASGAKAETIARARELIAAATRFDPRAREGRDRPRYPLAMQALAAMQAIQSRHFLCYLLGLLADACTKAGRHAEAMRSIP